MKTIEEILTALDSGRGDERLSQVYGQPAHTLGDVKQRIHQVAAGFQSAYGKGSDTPALIVTAAGRTELGGNHTDHQRGKVLAASVNLDALACCAPNGTHQVNIHSEGYGVTSVSLDQLEPVKEEENTTASLVRGILARITSEGYPVAGFDAYLTSNVPAGSGLSSSACYEVLVGEMVNGLFCQEKLSLAEVAMIGQYAENVYFGKPSGLMDQMACALGGIVTIDFQDAQNPVYRSIPIDFAAQNMALCIIDTGADHADLTGDYAAIPVEMGQVAACFGKTVLSEVDPADFYAAIPQVRKEAGDRAVLRAIHYYNDVSRVDQEVAALDEGNFQRFLELVSESGRSSFMYLQNIETYRSAASQPVAISLALAEHLLQGEGAFRVHGGGFAGTIQAFVPLSRLEHFVSGMDAVLGQGATKVLSIRPVGGAVLL
jgi:galactokinase